jgi:hypothetical protein
LIPCRHDTYYLPMCTRKQDEEDREEAEKRRSDT